MKLTTKLDRRIIAPEGGWQQDTIYLVRVQWKITNPMHTAILQTGFVENGEFAGYCRVWNNTYDDAPNAREAHYLEVIKILHQKGT